MFPLSLLVGGRRDARNVHAGAATLCITQVQSTAAVKWAAAETVANCSSDQSPASAVNCHLVY